MDKSQQVIIDLQLIDSAGLKVLLDFYNGKRDSLLREVARLDEQIKAIKDNIPDDDFLQYADKYDIHWSWYEKIRFILKLNKKPMTANKILNIVNSLEAPNKITERHISVVLANLNRKNGGCLKKEKIDNRMTYAYKEKVEIIGKETEEKDEIEDFS